MRKFWSLLLDEIAGGRGPESSGGDGWRVGVYLTGCVSFSLGAHFFIYSGLGTDPLDVFSLGVLRHLPLTIGICQGFIAVLCVGGWALWNRRRPLFMPFFTFFFCGSVIDVFQWIDVAGRMHAPHYPIMLIGTVLCAYASALIIMSGIGIRPIDLLALSIRERLGWKFWCAKASIEGTLLFTGWLMGGPVGVGTVCFLVFVDTLIQPCIWFNVRTLGMANHGFRSREPVLAGAS